MSDTKYNLYNCFVSSPNDVVEERRIAESTIMQLNATCLDVLKLGIKVIKWEDIRPATHNLSEETIQDMLNTEVAKSHFFVLILYKRYGSIENGYDISNTERELNVVLEQFKIKPSVRILAYFRDLSNNDDPGEQEQKVRDFRDRLESLNVLYKTYKNPNDFKEKLTHDLYAVILRMQLSTYKHQVLQKFWLFGEVDRPASPKLVIIYPPVERIFSDPKNDNKFWLKRLEPHIYFEDHKAIEKIRKMFYLMGFKHYRIYTTVDIPAEFQSLNCLWICIPRAPRALSQLAKHKDIARFNFTKRSGGVMAKIEWKSLNGDKIFVSSPMANYLKEQRGKGKMDLSKGWSQQFDKIIVKDYAVLARLKNKNNSVWDECEPLYDYFIAGIRGLGTWGAAWFIDRKYKLLTDISEEDDVQLLLEVEFRGGSIFDVKNVSDKPQEYFDAENKLCVIKGNITNYLES